MINALQHTHHYCHGFTAACLAYDSVSPYRFLIHASDV